MGDGEGERPQQQQPQPAGERAQKNDDPLHPIQWMDGKRPEDDPSLLDGLTQEQKERIQHSHDKDKFIEPRSINIDLFQQIMTVFNMFATAPGLDKRSAGYCLIAYFMAGGKLPMKHQDGETIVLTGPAEKIAKFAEFMKEASETIFGDDSIDDEGS